MSLLMIALRCHGRSLRVLLLRTFRKDLMTWELHIVGMLRCCLVLMFRRGDGTWVRSWRYVLLLRLSRRVMGRLWERLGGTICILLYGLHGLLRMDLLNLRYDLNTTCLLMTMTWFTFPRLGRLPEGLVFSRWLLREW